MNEILFIAIGGKTSQRKRLERLRVVTHNAEFCVIYNSLLSKQ